MSSTTQLLGCFSYPSDQCGRHEPDSDNTWYLSPPENKTSSPTSAKVLSKRRFEEVETDKQEAEVDGTNQKLSAKEEKKRRRLEGRIVKESINKGRSATVTSDVQTADNTFKDNVNLKLSDKTLQQVMSSKSDGPLNETGTEAALCFGLVSQPG